MRPEEVVELVAQLLDDEASGTGTDQARRDLLSLSANLIRVGDPLPNALRQWLASRLVDLHAALDGGDERLVRDALVRLGRRPRGRQAKASAGHDEWSGPEIAAAAAVLKFLAAPGRVAGIDEALAAAANASRATVQRACDEHPIDMGEREERDELREELRELALGMATPLLAKPRELAGQQDPRVHVQIRDLLRRNPRP